MTGKKQILDENDKETTQEIDDRKSEMPEMYGLGITYHRINKFMAGADFQFQKWADVYFYNPEQKFVNRMRTNIGAEYIPNSMSRKFFPKIRYRMGGFYSNSYFKDDNDSQFNEIGLSLGMSIPIVDRMTYHRSFINLAFEYSRLKPTNPLSMSEDYFKITLSYTLNELWFHKRKLQ